MTITLTLTTIILILAALALYLGSLVVGYGIDEFIMLLFFLGWPLPFAAAWFVWVYGVVREWWGKQGSNP